MKLEIFQIYHNIDDQKKYDKEIKNLGKKIMMKVVYMIKQMKNKLK